MDRLQQLRFMAVFSLIMLVGVIGSLVSEPKFEIHKDIVCDSITVMSPDKKIGVLIDANENGGIISLISGKTQTPRVFLAVDEYDNGGYILYDSTEKKRHVMMTYKNVASYGLYNQKNNDVHAVTVSSSDVMGGFIELSNGSKNNILWAGIPD